MSTVTIHPGALVIFDPSDKRTILFDFDLSLAATTQLAAAPTVTITPVRQGGVGVLTMDSLVLLAGNRTGQARFLATTATAGDKYQVSVKGVTTETPPQDKEKSFFILIQN
jgi:hypothetical protein